ALIRPSKSCDRFRRPRRHQFTLDGATALENNVLRGGQKRRGNAMLARKPWLTLFLMSGLLAAGATLAFAADASFTLKYGVLAGLTGDPAPSGQGWNASAKLGIDYIAATLDRMKLSGLKVELTDSQDSQGTPQQGVEAAQKLVQIDGVNVIIGDFYSSVTSAAATSVAIPNGIIMFTGGTNP